MTKVYYKQLKNGLKVVFEKRDLPIISTCIMVGVGGFSETKENKGVSHFIEHMVFKGTKNRNRKEITRFIEDKGGTLNAYTGESETCFWNTLPSKYLKESIELNTDMVFNPKFDKKDFEEEKKVILQEVSMLHDMPLRYGYDKMKSLMYTSGGGLPTVGTKESLHKLDIKTLKKFYNNNYGTNNMVLGVVGNANWKDILKEAEKLQDIRVDVKIPKIVKSNGEQLDERSGINQASIRLSRHLSTLDNVKDVHAYLLFSNILGKGMSSRLFENIREKEGLCYSINSQMAITNTMSAGYITAGVSKQNIEKTKQLILKEISNMSNLTGKELDLAKEKEIHSNEVSSESSSNSLFDLSSNVLFGHIDYYTKYEELINAVKLSEVKAFSKLKDYSFHALVPK